MNTYPRLFEPITIRGLTLKNRIVMPGMGTLFMSDSFVNDQLIDYHVARARGGTGLNVVEVSNVHAPSAPPRYGSLADDDHIAGYRRLTDAIHAAGGKASVFLWQGGMVAGGFPGVQAIVPSDMELQGQRVPGASVALLEEIRTCYGQAARRAVEAGMDAIELHAAHNYLLHAFLSGAINRRTDSYGGSFEARMRYPLEVIAEIRRHMPDDMPLFMRVNAHDDYLEGGLTIEETITFCRAAGAAGVDVIDVSRGNTMTNALKYEVPSCDIPYAFNVDNAARIRKETGMLTMAVGRINGAQLGETILEQGKADLVGMGRVQLTDPDYCNKAREGRVGEIARCIGCNQGCFDAHMRPDMPHITCLRNPAVGREREFERPPTDSPKTVIVAGGGAGGMEAAAVLDSRGHRVILCEAGPALGGHFATAGIAPRKGEFKAAMRHKATLLKKSGVDIRLDTALTPALIAELKPDVVINAIGSHPIVPPIPGADLGHVCGALPVLEGQVEPSGRVAVIGGGLVGLEVTEFLMEKGHEVTVIEMGDTIGRELGAIRRICVMENIAQYPVTLLAGAACMGIAEGAVTIKTAAGEQVIEADSVVMAAGLQSRAADDLAGACEALGIPLYTIGDATRARRALDAIAEAGALARRL